MLPIYLMYSFVLPFWIELKPSRRVALTAYCQSRPKSCARSQKICSRRQRNTGSICPRELSEGVRIQRSNVHLRGGGTREKGAAEARGAEGQSQTGGKRCRAAVEGAWRKGQGRDRLC